MTDEQLKREKQDRLFSARLRKFRGAYKQIAEESGINHALVRKYAEGKLPKYKRDNVKKVADWMRGRKP